MALVRWQPNGQGPSRDQPRHFTQEDLECFLEDYFGSGRSNLTTDRRTGGPVSSQPFGAPPRERLMGAV